MNASPAGRFVSVLLVALTVVACGGVPEVEETAARDASVEQVLLKGHVTFGHEVRSLRPCGGDEALWAIDSTQLLWELHRELALGLEPYEEIFVVVRGRVGDAPFDGFGADYPGTIIVNQVLYAAAEGFRCELDLSRFDYRLSGNEPFWTLSLLGERAELTRMDAPGSTWENLRSEAVEAGIEYVAEDVGSGTLQVSVSEAPCRDSMSGAYYGYSATVVLDGEELFGCVLRGAVQ